MKPIMSKLSLGVTSIAMVFTMTAPSRIVQAQVVKTIYNTSFPSVIRVAIRQYNNPVGPILYVQTVGFQEYCEDVLPNEWIPSWSPESLRAGAIAIKMFAWYHTLHPVTKGGFTYDVDNTTNFQEFKYLSGRNATNKAVKDTWKVVFTPSKAEIEKLNYRAGIPNNPNWSFVGSETMAQWGSQYWGNVAKLKYTDILRKFYPGHVVKYV